MSGLEVPEPGRMYDSGLLRATSERGTGDVHGAHRRARTVGVVARRGPRAAAGPAMSEPEPGRPGTPADLAAFFQAATERLMAGWTPPAGGGSSAPAGVPGSWPLRTPPLPATLSARQLQTLLDDLAARRAQVQALATQLAAFDEQLGSLEANLRPVLDWVETWAELEKSVAGLWRPPGSASSGSEES